VLEICPVIWDTNFFNRMKKEEILDGSTMPTQQSEIMKKIDVVEKKIDEVESSIKEVEKRIAEVR